MEKYKILMELNRKEIFAEKIIDDEKEEAVSTFLDGICCREDIQKYKKRMQVNPDTDCIYPDFYIPPYNENKKLRLIQGYLPKTNILYANHYELEIIRLLFMFAPENEKVNELVKHTLQRLKNTCFGNSCTQGECLAAGISVLRFLAVTQPGNSEWIDKLLNPLGDIFVSVGNRHRLKQTEIPLSYLIMAFTDINNEQTRSLIAQKKEWLLGLLEKGRTKEDGYDLVKKHIIKNAIGTLG